jgi:hypothetical protein
MQRAKTQSKATSAVHPVPADATLPGIKYCQLCEQLVHPYAAYYECKMEFCSDKGRTHRKCMAYRMDHGAKTVDIACTNCRMTSRWQRRAWVDTMKSLPSKIVWTILAAIIPMMLVKLLGFGVDDPEAEDYKWAPTQKVIFSHVFISLAIVGFIRGCWWLFSATSNWSRWILSKLCCCCGCCRRNKYEDIY